MLTLEERRAKWRAYKRAERQAHPDRDRKYRASASGLEVQRRGQRAYVARNREKVRCAARDRHRKLVARGVCTHRLREPRGHAAWAGRLRWARPQSSTPDRDGSVWEALQRFDYRVIRRRERHSLLESSTGPGEQWLRKQK